MVGAARFPDITDDFVGSMPSTQARKNPPPSLASAFGVKLCISESSTWKHLGSWMVWCMQSRGEISHRGVALHRRKGPGPPGVSSCVVGVRVGGCRLSRDVNRRAAVHALPRP